MKKKHKHHHDWGHLKDTRMRYEKPNTMHFSAGEAYANAPIWQTCDFCGKEFMGADLLSAHKAERHPEGGKGGAKAALLQAIGEKTAAGQKVEARAKAATEGPWRAEERFEWQGEMVWTIDGPVWLFEDSVSKQNAEFIAHARTDVPKLVEEVRKLSERLRLAEADNAYLRDRAEDCTKRHILGQSVEIEVLRKLAAEAAAELRAFWDDDGGCGQGAGRDPGHTPEKCPTGWCRTLELSEKLSAVAK